MEVLTNFSILARNIFTKNVSERALSGYVSNYSPRDVPHERSAVNISNHEAAVVN